MHRCDIIFWLVRFKTFKPRATFEPRATRVPGPKGLRGRRPHSNCVSSNCVQQLSQNVCKGVTLFPQTVCNNCLKMYVKVWHYSLQITIISQLFAWYIQSQHIYSNKTYSSNFWQHISNTNVILQKRTIPNSGLKETLSIYNHPPNVALFYPIAIYIFHAHILPKLFALHI